MLSESASNPVVSDAEIAPHDPRYARRNRLVIAVLLISTFVVILNETLMIVAIPHLMNAMGVTAGAAQWLTTAFLLTMAVVIPVTGFLLQRLNTRPVFLLAMLLFSAGTLVCALSPGLEMLVFGRVVQASGTAIMMPLLMTTIMMLVPPEHRGQFMGNISVVISVAPALGPMVGGLILSRFEWPWLFWLVLPIALSATYFGYKRIVNIATTRYAPVDIVSVALSVAGFGGVVYGLSTMGQIDQTAQPIVPWHALLIGSLAMLIFIWRQILLQRRDGALLDMRTFQSRGFAINLGMMAVAMMTFFGAIILLPIYMQNVLALSTLQTGLIFLPGGLIMGLLAPSVGRWYDRHGPARLVIPGAVIFSAVLWSMTIVDTQTSWIYILVGHILIGASLALVFTPLFTASMGAIPPSLYSHGSAMLGSIQQLAGAAGIALLVSLMTAESAHLISIGAAMREALAGGIRNAFFWGAFISTLMVVAAFFVRRPADNSGGHQ